MTVAISPFRPRHATGDAESWNILLGFGGQPLPLASPSATATFDLADAPSETTIAIAFHSARGPRLVAVFEQAPFSVLFDAELDMQDVLGLPPNLREALLRGILSLVWDALPENHFGACAVETVGALREIGFDAPADWFAFEIEGLAPQPITGRLGCAQGALSATLLSGALATTAIDRALRERLNVDVFISLERLRLRLSEARGLRSGDIVVLSESAAERVIVRVTRANWEAAPSAEGLTVMAVSWSGGGNEDRRETLDATDAAEGLDIAKLTIDIDFDIGRVSKPLAEIESWRPGSVIAIDMPQLADGLGVTLRVNGAPIGVGELVKIDDRIAVRISRWTM